MRSVLDRMIFNQFAFIFVAFCSISFFFRHFGFFSATRRVFARLAGARVFSRSTCGACVCNLSVHVCVCVFILATNFNVVVADFLVVSFIFTQHRRRRLAD